MRRIRQKVAPNLLSAARSSKVVTENVVVDKSQENETLTTPTRNAETNSNQEPSVNLVTNDEVTIPEKSALIEPLLPHPEQDTVTPPEVLEITSSVDKENVLTLVSDEASRDSQANASANEPGGPSLSRYKARNKIRPVISNAPHRIRTFSSASESEDDAAKRQSRTPLSPVKKSPAKKDNVDPTPPLPPATATVKGKRGKKKSDEKTALEIKKAATKRKIANGEVGRSKLTMFDIIYYNPNDGERPPNSEKLQMRLKPFEVEALAMENQADKSESTGNYILDEKLAEEEEMRRMEENPENENEGDEQPEKVEDEEDEEEDAMPVPQVRLDANGDIILDETTLTIETSEAKRNKSQLANSGVIVEHSNTMVNYGSWRKRRRAGRWSMKETARFYRALQMLGSNFSLMTKLFPGRDRVDLKRKFKSEEKTNPALVDKIISTQIPFDPSHFMDETEEDSSGAESVTKEKQKKTSKANKTTSKESKGKSQGKGKALLKKTVAIEEPNSNEDDSDVVSIASIRSPYKKTSNEESEEDREPPKKKGRKVKVTESQVSTRGRKTANVSRTRKATREKKVLHSDSDGEQPSPAEIETGEQPSTSKKAESQVSTRGRKTANVSRPRKATRGRKVLHSDSDGEQPTSSAEIETVEQPSSSKTAQTATPSSNNTIDSLLNSPLGQIGLEQGGLTVVEDLGTPNQAPSFLVPPVLAEANPAFAQAQPGSLVLVSEPNPGDPDNQLVHVYRVAVPLQPVPLVRSPLKLA